MERVAHSGAPLHRSTDWLNSSPPPPGVGVQVAVTGKSAPLDVLATSEKLWVRSNTTPLLTTTVVTEAENGLPATAALFMESAKGFSVKAQVSPCPAPGGGVQVNWQAATPSMSSGDAKSVPTAGCVQAGFCI